MKMPDRKFTTLRKRLDQLGYRQPLVVEAVPLVEKLFSDLIHTTESFKNYKAQPLKFNESGIGDLSEPYKNDNARLMTENNELHKELIRCKDEIEKLTVEMKAAVNKLENENQDLKFLNTQYVYTIKNMEKESKLKNDHIMNLEERNMNAVVETPGGKKKNIPFRRQRMDIESTLSQSSVSVSFANDSKLKQEDPYVVDLLTVADNRMENLKHQIFEFQSGNEKLEKQCRILKKQVVSREKEIERLNRLLEGGRPIEAVVKDVKHQSSNKVLAHLNIQVDYLQQANRDFEKKIVNMEQGKKEKSKKLKELQDRNDELCMELAAMDKMYKNLGKEKRTDDEEVDEQISVLKEKIEGKQQIIIDLQGNNHNLKKEREGLIEENEQLMVTNKDMDVDKTNLLDLYDRCEKEKRRLTEKNARLTVSERELAMELERVKISKGFLPKKSPDQLKFLIRNLEDDRDHYKKELDSLQKLVHDRLFAKSNIRTETKQHESNAIIQLLQEERDYFKKEYEVLRSKKAHTPPTKDKEDSFSNEFARVKRERDELQKMLENFEKHLTEITENVKEVTTEKDNIQLLYEQAIEEVQKLRRKQSKNVSPSRKITSILEKAENERDEALLELRKARSEIQNMKGEIRQIQKTYEEERIARQHQQRNAEELLDKIDNDNNNLNNRMSSTQNMVHTLEDQLSRANKTVRKYQENVHGKDTEVSKLRLLLEQSERSNNELRKKCEEKTVLLGELEDKNSNLQEDLGRLDRKITDYKQEIIRLKEVTSSLDRERDGLQQEVDEKSEELLKLDNGLREQEKADTELKLSLEELEENLRYREQELSSKDREILGLQKQIHSLEEELSGLSKAREITIRENKRILDDLSLMTEENQDIHQQLRDQRNECESLKEQIEEYATHVGRVEDLLAQKELEKEELLLQYKSLSSKASELQNNIQQNEDDSETTKQDLIHCKQEVDYLQGRCSVLEAQIEQHISNEESYESQINTLMNNVNSLENQVQSSNDESNTIVKDFHAVRELCVRLDKTREELTKKLADKTTAQEQLEQMLSESRSETLALKNQVAQEINVVKNLENVISSAREKQILEKNHYEKETFDYDRIKSELEKIELENSNKEEEYTNLQRQNMTLQDEISSLRNQLTSEKFEHERVRQEIRRKSNSPDSRVSITTDDDSRRKSTAAYVTNYTKRTTGNFNMGASTRTKRNVSFSPLQVSFSSSSDGES